MKMFLALVKTGVVSQDQDTPIPALAPEISLRSKGRQLLLYRNTSLVKPVYCMSILLCVLHCPTCLRCPHFYSLPFQLHVSFKATSYMKPPRSFQAKVTSCCSEVTALLFQSYNCQLNFHCVDIMLYSKSYLGHTLLFKVEISLACTLYVSRGNV